MRGNIRVGSLARSPRYYHKLNKIDTISPEIIVIGEKKIEWDFYGPVRFGLLTVGIATVEPQEGLVLSKKISNLKSFHAKLAL